ncbi:DUF2007 domain-containing protein [Vibrio alfacsensis]|uniref:DUF2007 domain-containing protein n=1 Tax=Vibrio alfacsensis TaxID=1074311 RepID=UPI004067EC4E
MKIYIAQTPTEAHIVCELLKTEHIVCEVRGENLFGLKGELPFGDDTDPYIWLLHPEQKLKASVILEEYRKQAEPTYLDWQCPQCLEQNEGQFGACWHCGYQIGEP